MFAQIKKINSSFFKNTNKVATPIFPYYTKKNFFERMKEENKKVKFSKPFKVGQHQVNECVAVNNSMVENFRKTGSKGYDKVGYVNKEVINKKIEDGTLYAIYAKTNTTEEMAGFANMSPVEAEEVINDANKVSNHSVQKILPMFKGVYFGNFISTGKYPGFGSTTGKGMVEICKENNYNFVVAAVEKSNKASWKSIAKMGFTFMSAFQDNFAFTNAYGEDSQISIFHTFSFVNEKFKDFVFYPSVVPGSIHEVEFENDEQWNRMVEENTKENRTVFVENGKIYQCGVNQEVFFKKAKEFAEKEKMKNSYENFKSCNYEFDSEVYFETSKVYKKIY